MIAVPRMRVTPPAITLRYRAEFIPIYTYCISRNLSYCMSQRNCFGGKQLQV